MGEEAASLLPPSEIVLRVLMFALLLISFLCVSRKFGASRFSGGGGGFEKKPLKRSHTFTPGSRAGRGGEGQSKKEMLLQWVQQKTDGYRVKKGSFF